MVSRLEDRPKLKETHFFLAPGRSRMVQLTPYREKTLTRPGVSCATFGDEISTAQPFTNPIILDDSTRVPISIRGGVLKISFARRRLRARPVDEV